MRLGMRVVSAVIGAACVLLPWAGRADEGDDRPTFTEKEIRIILTHGPWRSPVGRDPSNRVLGNRVPRLRRSEFDCLTFSPSANLTVLGASLKSHSAAGRPYFNRSVAHCPPMVLAEPSRSTPPFAVPPSSRTWNVKLA